MRRAAAARDEKVAGPLPVRDARAEQQRAEREREADEDWPDVRPEEERGRFDARVDVVLAVLARVDRVVDD